MTKNALEYQALQEEKRANREKEDLARMNWGLEFGNSTWKALTDIVKMATGAASSGQDSSWYTRGGESGSSYQFVWNGAFKDIINPSGNTEENTPDGEYLTNPYLYILNWYPTIGTRPGSMTSGVQAASPIRSAINTFFTNNRRANSGAKNYDATDYYQWILGYDSVLTAIAEATRVYELANLGKTKSNWYYYNMIQQLGWNATDLIDNLADFYTKLCNIIKDLNSMDVPAGLAFMEKHRVMGLNIFRDEDIDKSHYYAFRCPQFMIYNELAGELGVYAGFANNNDYKTNLNLIKTLITALSSGTTRVMSGDTGKWDINVMKLGFPTEGKEIEFNTDKNWLLEIHNATIVGPVEDDSELSICQSHDGESLYQGYVKSGGSYEALGIQLSTNTAIYDQNNTTSESQFNGMTFYTKGALINCYENNPSLDTVIDITKLAATTKIIHYGTGSNQVNRLAVDAHGSEIVTELTVCGLMNAGGGHGYSFNIYENVVLTATNFFKACAALSRANYAPHMNIIMSSSGLALNKSSFNSLQAGNMAWIPSETLGEQYRTALLSLLAYTAGTSGSNGSTEKKESKGSKSSSKK